MEIADDDQPEDTTVWATPRWLLGVIALRFCENVSELITKGIKRRAASHLARWLWNAEVIVRRLLLAAAFALKIDPPRPTQPAPAPASPANTPPPVRKQRHAFHTFAIHAPATSTAHPAAPHAPPAARSRPAMRPNAGVMPLDPLLCIGGHSPRARTPARQRKHTRFAPPPPLYQSDEDYERDLLGPTHKPEPDLAAGAHIPTEPRKHRDIHDPWGFRHCMPTLFDDERLYPAPALAGRLAALITVLAKPEAAASRLAHILARRASAPKHFAAVEPAYFWRKPNDPLPDPPCLTEMLQAHRDLTNAVAFNDTS